MSHARIGAPFAKLEPNVHIMGADMSGTRFATILLAAGALSAQGLLLAQGWTNPKSDVAPNALDVSPGDQEYVCPMDADIRSSQPGKCPRCGMTLVKGVVERVEYPVKLETGVKVLKPGVLTHLNFEVQDPKNLTTVKDFEIVHEKLFHLFIISQDLTFFRHEHPELTKDSHFVFDVKFPKPGLYRILTDFYPKSGTPQLVEKTLLVSGEGFNISVATLKPDMSEQHGENVDAELIVAPAKPVAGQKTILFLRMRPNDGIEPYLGAMAHMMAGSSDLIDMIHSHPIVSNDVQADGGKGDYKELQFNVYFPRPGIYRVWMQFQRKGVVNTVAFNVPVYGVSDLIE